MQKAPYLLVETVNIYGRDFPLYRGRRELRVTEEGARAFVIKQKLKMLEGRAHELFSENGRMRCGGKLRK